MSNFVLHHRAKKGRVGKRLYSLADRLIYTAAIVSPLATLPQVYQIFSTREVAGLSLLSWAIFTGINLIWIVYGLHHKLMPILLSNLLSFIFNCMVVAGIVLYH